MTIHSIWKAATCALVAGGLVLAAAKPPQPKSQKEFEAIQAVFSAKDPDTQLAAAQNLLTKFADTEFKAIALQICAFDAQQKNDYENMVIYAERTLEVDPESYGAMLMLAAGIAQKTREFDLDKNEKLASSEKYARSAIPLIEKAEKPRPEISDEQWATAKKDYLAKAHEALAISAVVRKKYDVAISEFKISIENAAQPDQTTLVRLAGAYNGNNQPTEALAAIDKLMAMPDLNPAVKQVAQSEKDRAIRLKAMPTKPAPAAAAPGAVTPQVVDIKK